MTRLLLLPFLALAGCTAPEGGGAPLGGLFGGPEPEVPAPLPPQVLAALPPGVPPSVVTRNADGCYLLTIERTVPPSGFPLTDAAGNQVCEAGAVPLDGTAAAPGAAVPGPVTPPAPIAPPDPA